MFLLFLAGIGGYLYYFFKVDKMYARKVKRKKGKSASGSGGKKGADEPTGTNSAGAAGSKSPIDAAAAVVSAVFKPQQLVPLPGGAEPTAAADQPPPAPRPAAEGPQLDELTNKPPPILMRPLPATTNAYNRPLEVDKLPAHLFGGKALSASASSKIAASKIEMDSIGDLIKETIFFHFTAIPAQLTRPAWTRTRTGPRAS